MLPIWYFEATLSELEVLQILKLMLATIPHDSCEHFLPYRYVVSKENMLLLPVEKKSSKRTVAVV